MISCVIDANVTLNLLYVDAHTCLSIKKLLSELENLENFKIVIPHEAYKEIKRVNQRRRVKNWEKSSIVKIHKPLSSDEIDNCISLFSRRLHVGEISMFLIVRKNKNSIGFTNEVLATKKFSKLIPLLHGIWFFRKMYELRIITEDEFNKIVKISNKDMKLPENILASTIENVSNIRLKNFLITFHL